MDHADAASWLAAGWGPLLGAVTVVIVLSQMWTRINVIEEKVRALFDIINNKK